MLGALRLARTRLDPYRAAHFLVEIEGLVVGGFAQCTGLEVQIEGHEYREGGVNDFVHHFAGRTLHPPLVLRHGISPLDGLWSWHRDTAAGVIKRRNGTIMLLDEQQQVAMFWHFKQALPLKWTGPELNADRSAVAFESIELVHHGLSRPRTDQASEDTIAGPPGVTGTFIL
jgi:phage tail-like protein